VGRGILLVVARLARAASFADWAILADSRWAGENV